MAKVNTTLIKYSGKVDEVVHYTRFGRSYSRRVPKEYNDRRSEAQLKQRALFTARQKTASLMGMMLQRGLTKEAHAKGMTEANYFSRLNKDCFVYEEGRVRVDYERLVVGTGPLPVVVVMGCKVKKGLVEVSLYPNMEDSRAKGNDVVHIYAVGPKVGVCELVASTERRTTMVSFELPVVGVETKGRKVFYLYAIVEAASTARINTLSTAEKVVEWRHRNINRRVSQSVYVGCVTVR